MGNFLCATERRDGKIFLIKKFISDDMKNILIAGLIFLAAVGLAFADSAKNNFSGMMVGNKMEEMMNSNGMGMHGMMMDSESMSEMMKNHHGADESMNGMGCMGMMKNADSLTKEEKEKMLADMDKDGDGKCDMCGMSIEMCRSMMK